MRPLVTLILLFSIWSDVYAWSCGVKVEFKNDLSEKVYVRLNVEFQEFDAPTLSESGLREFVAESNIVHILQPHQLKPVSLGYPCMPKFPEDENWSQPPKEIWFSYEVWGRKIGNVIRYEKDLVIHIE